MIILIRFGFGFSGFKYCFGSVPVQSSMRNISSVAIFTLRSPQFVLRVNVAVSLDHPGSVWRSSEISATRRLLRNWPPSAWGHLGWSSNPPTRNPWTGALPWNHRGCGYLWYMPRGSKEHKSGEHSGTVELGKRGMAEREPPGVLSKRCPAVTSFDGAE